MTSPPGSIILASRSPRRRDLLAALGLPHRVVPAEVDETPRTSETPVELARRVAMLKASAVAERFPGPPVLAADTVVDLEGRALGKPEDEETAAGMLRSLGARRHQVHTGLAVVYRGRSAGCVDTAHVTFRALDETMIRWYVATGEPADKAGAYAVQGAGGVLVEHVDGSPHTVIGLPLHRLPRLFSTVGLDLWSMLDGGDGVPRGGAPTV